MNLKTSRSICPESGDSETPNVETSKKPVPAKPFGVSQPYRGNWARVRNYTGHATLPQGSSTIDDILRQYKNSEGASTNSEFHPNTQSRNVSYMTDGSGLFSDSHDGRYTTHARPLGKVGMPRSVAQNDIASIAPASEKQASTSSTSDNFLQPRSTSPPNDPRVPLEHAIMELRRNSDDSINSCYAPSTIRGSTLTQPPPAPYQAQMSRQASEAISIDEETRRLVKTVLCYNEVSMDPTWSADGNGISPINKRIGLIQPAMYETTANTSSHQDDDGKDWETIDTASPDNHRVSTSLGTVSTLDGINLFEPAERVVQHPGAIHFNGSYRQLNLKQGQIPIIAPTKDLYRINGGHLQNSMRTGPYPVHYTKPNDHERTFEPNTRNMAPNFKQQTKPFPPRNNDTHSTSSLGTDNNYIKHAGTGVLMRRMPDDHENDSIFLTNSSISTTHPRQLSYSHQGLRLTEQGSPNASLAGPSGHRNYGSSNTVQIPSVHPSRAQGDGSRGPAYTGEGRPRRPRPRYKPSDDILHQFGTPNIDHHQKHALEIVHSKFDARGAPLYQVDLADEAPRQFTNFEIEEPDNVSRDTKQEKISLYFVILCNLFPPLLLFLWVGKLDNLMGWWSRWEFHQFTARGKRLAKLLAILWLIAIIVATIVLGIVKVGITNRAHRH
ncbi:hypothetical protein V8E51_017038 [Hyaloscypha variabilis]